MFQKLSPLAADPILGLMAAYRLDNNAHKIDLGVGVYKDETGATPVMRAVKEAESRLLATQKTKPTLGQQARLCTTKKSLTFCLAKP